MDNSLLATPMEKINYDSLHHKFVLVLDVHLLSMKTNLDHSTILSFINRNISVLWSSKISYNTISNESTGIAKEYSKIGVRFDGEIHGLFGTFKNMKQFRQHFRKSSWLNLPVVFIDSDLNSVSRGGWDCALSIQNYMNCSDLSINLEVLDACKLFKDIAAFLFAWYD